MLFFKINNIVLFLFDKIKKLKQGLLIQEQLEPEK